MPQPRQVDRAADYTLESVSGRSIDLGELDHAGGFLKRPQKLIDATQAWFWNSTWQAGERGADADRAAGLVESFESGEALLSGRGR